MLQTPVQCIPEGQNRHGCGAALASILGVAQAWGVLRILKPAEVVILEVGLPPFLQHCKLVML